MQSASHETVFEKVARALGHTVYLEGLHLTPATRIAKDLHIGRFGRLKLALYLEETFAVELADEVMKQFETVDDITRYMNRWSREATDMPGPEHAPYVRIIV